MFWIGPAAAWAVSNADSRACMHWFEELYTLLYRIRFQIFQTKQFSEEYTWNVSTLTTIDWNSILKLFFIIFSYRSILEGFFENVLHLDADLQQTNTAILQKTKHSFYCPFVCFQKSVHCKLYNILAIVHVFQLFCSSEMYAKHILPMWP